MIGLLKELYWWSSSVWVVKKSKTNELWVVGDFRLLNSKTISDESAITDLRESIEHLALVIIFSLLDLLKAYNSITATSRAQEQLVLATEFGNYMYLVMPFGPISAPSIFAKAMNIVFAELIEFVSVYFDDVTVYSTDPDDHLKHLEWTFQLICQYKFTLKPDKCEFLKEKVEFLEHKVSFKGISSSDKLINKVSVCEPPKSKADIKAFIHLCGFYHSHIQGFAEIASSLTEMLKKNVSFKMNKCQE